VFKRGICTLSELQSLRGVSPTKPVSYRLLRHWISRTEAIPAFEAIVRHLELSTGICRTTYRGRFQDVDTWVGRYLTEFFTAEKGFEVHDWAASDSLVSSEWAQVIFREFPSCYFVASDLILYLVEASQGKREAYIFEPSGRPLQYVRAPFVILFNRRDSSVFVVNRLMRLWAECHVESPQDSMSQCRWKSVEDSTEFSVPPLMIRLLPLVHPEARALQRQSPQFRIVLHSALLPLPKKVHVIRTMNIYQPGYFGSSDLGKGIQAVFDSLVVGGLWILGRTVEERKPVRNEVSIFIKSERCFRLLDRLNGGSEIEQSLRNSGFLNGYRD
jgi:hypothetical protein